MALKKLTKRASCVVVAATAAALSGCGFDDVQFNGKIFDAMGMNTGSVKQKEPTMAARQPLIVPPGLEGLPEPGSGKANQPSLADVQDYDAAKSTSKADLERQQAEYCKKNYEMASAHGDNTAHLAEGPLGPCRGSVLTAIKNINKGESEGDGQ